MMVVAMAPGVKGLDSWPAEVANPEVDDDRLVATGTQIGVDPVAYRLDYSLDAGPAFMTHVLTVEASGEGWRRQLRLVRHADGSWTCDTTQRGDAPLPPAGGDVEAVRGALDCDWWSARQRPWKANVVRGTRPGSGRSARQHLRHSIRGATGGKADYA